MRRIRRPIGAVSLVVVAALAVALGTTVPAAADPKFPSWSDVQRAKHSVKAKRAEIVKLTGLISTIQAQAASAGKLALVRNEQYLEAKIALSTATLAASRLKNSSDAAKKKADASAAEAGQLAAQLARQGDGSISLELLLNGHSAGNLLNVLGTMTKLTESSSKIFAAAQQDHLAAAALSGQATVAQRDRTKKAAKAKTDLAAAKAASAAATAKLAAVGKTQKVMTAQLASLKGVSKKTEKQYFAGVAWEKKQAAQKAPPADGAPPAGGSAGAPDGSKVDGAIAFARAQLGKPYRLDGAGPSTWDCSGLTLEAYASVGIYIGTHSATNQYSTLRSEGKLVPLSDRQAGDILWYSDGGSTTGIKYHVTLYIGNGLMIEAPYPGSVVRIAAVRFGDLVPYAGRPTG